MGPTITHALASELRITSARRCGRASRTTTSRTFGPSAASSMRWPRSSTPLRQVSCCSICLLHHVGLLHVIFLPGCMKNLILKIIRGSYPPISSKYSYDIRNLVSGLLKKRPEDRPALVNILRKTFIKRSLGSVEDLKRHAVGKRMLGARAAVYLRQQQQQHWDNNGDDDFGHPGQVVVQGVPKPILDMYGGRTHCEYHISSGHFKDKCSYYFFQSSLRLLSSACCRRRRRQRTEKSFVTILLPPAFPRRGSRLLLSRSGSATSSSSSSSSTSVTRRRDTDEVSSHGASGQKELSVHRVVEPRIIGSRR